MVKTYIAEIDGRAVLAFRAPNDVEADAWLDAAVFDAFLVLESENRPLWDGEAESWFGLPETTRKPSGEGGPSRARRKLEIC